jgi:predicted DNA-binding transcriptional regulator AlpA
MTVDDSQSPEFGEPLLVTAHEFARLLQISVRTLWRMRSAGHVPSPISFGATVRWRLDEIKKWIADGCPKREARDNEGLRRQ